MNRMKIQLKECWMQNFIRLIYVHKFINNNNLHRNAADSGATECERLAMHMYDIYVFVDV